MFRKALVVLAAAIVAIAIPAGATAHHSLIDYQSAVDSLLAVDPLIEPAANDSSKDFAVGGFQGPLQNNNFGFSAHSGPLGEDPQGHLSETIPGTFQGRFRVTCLFVFLNEAAIGLAPTDAASNDQPEERVLSVADSGIPGGTGDLFGFIDGLKADLCFFGFGAAGIPLEHGNIVVHDALP